MLFTTLYKFQPTCMVQEELKWKCPTTSPVSGTSVQSVNFSVALLILNEKLGEKKNNNKKTDILVWRAEAVLLVLWHF